MSKRPASLAPGDDVLVVRLVPTSISVGKGEVILPGRADRLPHNGMAIALSSIISLGHEARRENGVALHFAIIVLNSGVTITGIVEGHGEDLAQIWQNHLQRRE
jgi:hypothetical protein